MIIVLGTPVDYPLIARSTKKILEVIFSMLMLIAIALLTNEGEIRG
ncbi:MAG: hypothetical protein UU65_C0003G0121 [candidate division CPR2 bacterium GW2011_GWC1_41_48]|uniref:Uncharacterized protein n=1 Tax=candidate division CPR2 bacterium GW2011_GWC1_41_48 TaxID=1618344 RepID=A0A0G0YHM3_UNCC2|nr:MAG: hypothetical protein UT47_C0003G0127 [candidate division CPR2 bacterium GW2011_GWC2_39_35]KKR28349.1 MAG: hypothetical protein UT60_C0022G0005 [candidate division CPR2 bacterium GW2011_GWD2_39_7]KKR28386.1 MAG: hypothetical protein UT59_C0029G0010 [candidate division CPR2 bacterium GW2011_GWD1_39_7]KKS09066.1 MAG: hypothetical protein UU65_C0003G0121 [candidate division CPR2 bacterium GW2011_GWC1_41_48]